MTVTSPADAVVDVPVAEVTVSTRADEARIAVALVDQLRRQDVSRRDILLVARDLDTYERTLTRSAMRRGITLTFWSQLDLRERDLYQVLVGTCELLGAQWPTAAQLETVLAAGWTPPEPGDAWPMDTETVTERFASVSAETAQGLETWRTHFEERGDTQPLRLQDWLSNHREPPTPDSIRSTLWGLLDRYREIVLPRIQREDGPAYRQTKQAARAVATLENLVGQAALKFGDRVEDGRVDRTWTAVASLLETLATQRPGRREHSNARAIDAVEANDVFGMRAQYVIALGLVEGEWPAATVSALPPQLRARINDGANDVAQLLPWPSWDGIRVADQFAETLGAATKGVVVSRHTRTVEGDSVSPSPLLADVSTNTVEDDAARTLLADRETQTGSVLNLLEHGSLDPQEDAQ